MELQLWLRLRLLVFGSLAVATNSSAGSNTSTTSSSATSSSATCPYDPTLAATWVRAHGYSGGSRAELQLGKAHAHSYSWGRLTQCPQASWVERYTQLVNAGQAAGEAGEAGEAWEAASGPALIVGGNKGTCAHICVPTYRTYLPHLPTSLGTHFGTRACRSRLRRLGEHALWRWQLDLGQP